MYPDTPLPQEEPAGQNPPDGAMVDYYLNQKANIVMLEIVDKNGTVVRKYTDKDTLYKIPPVNIPLYWIRPQQILSAEAGSHRFLWDLRYAPLNIPPSYPISAIYMNTAPNETSPWVLPGMYTVRLRVDDKIFSQPFEVKMDPRVKTSMEELNEIHRIAFLCYDGRQRCMKALNKIADLRQQLKESLTKANNQLVPKIKEVDSLLDRLVNTPPGSNEPGFNKMNNDFAALFAVVNESDLPVTTQSKEAAAKLRSAMELLLIKWMQVRTNDIRKLNELLKKSGLPVLSAAD